MTKLPLTLLLLIFVMAGCGLIPPSAGLYMDDNPLKKDTVQVLYNKNEYTVYIHKGDTVTMRTYMFSGNYHKIN